MSCVSLRQIQILIVCSSFTVNDGYRRLITNFFLSNYQDGFFIFFSIPLIFSVITSYPESIYYVYLQKVFFWFDQDERERTKKNWKLLTDKSFGFIKVSDIQSSRIVFTTIEVKSTKAFIHLKILWVKKDDSLLNSLHTLLFILGFSGKSIHFVTSRIVMRSRGYVTSKDINLWI